MTKLTPQTALVMDALIQSPGLAGADLMRATKLKSGSLYPILRRLEEAGWITGNWEEIDPREAGRPRRRFYKVTATGRRNAARAAQSQATVLGRLGWA